MTAAERRAAGEAAFCACSGCVGAAERVAQRFAQRLSTDPGAVVALIPVYLRALVLSTLLVTLLPAGWCEP